MLPRIFEGRRLLAAAFACAALAQAPPDLAPWPPFARTGEFPAVEEADRAWIRQAATDPQGAAVWYAPGALVLAGAEAARRDDKALAGHLALLGSLCRQATGHAVRFRLSPREGTVVERLQLTMPSGPGPLFQIWWTRTAGGWRKRVEALAVPGEGPAEARGALDGARAIWQARVDAKDPEALAAAAYDAEAAYLRQYDGSFLVFEGRSGIAEEYGGYIPRRGYALGIRPLSVDLATPATALEIGVFQGGVPGKPRTQGLYFFVWRRRSPEGPWQIVLETDVGESGEPAPLPGR